MFLNVARTFCWFKRNEVVRQRDRVMHIELNILDQ